MDLPLLLGFGHRHTLVDAMGLEYVIDTVMCFKAQHPPQVRLDHPAPLPDLQPWPLIDVDFVSEAEAAAIRAALEQRGEFAVAVELRLLFPGVIDTAQARERARDIAAWKPPQVKRRLVRVPGKGP